jgi:hydrogen cyanide synthase HcnB
MIEPVREVIIVGGGRAGISAATELARYGICCRVIDEAPKIGGVVYRGPLRKTDSLPHLDPYLKRAMAALHTRYEQHKDSIELELESTVLGPEENKSLVVNHQGKIEKRHYDALILSTGCHERSVPFPGWQLPGVMLMGGVQLQIKSGLVRPGKKMAIVGTGPLLPLIACQLHRSGVEVAGVYEASSFGKLAKEAVALMNKPQLTLQGFSMMAYLKRNGIPFKYGWGIVEAKGTDEVKSIVVAPYNNQWQADINKSETVEVDSLAVGYGFVSRIQLSQLFGLQHQYDEMSGYIPVLDDSYMSSVDGVYAVGDSSGVLGGDGAIYSGQLAALAIARRFNKITEEEFNKKTAKAQARLNRVKRFRWGFDRFSERQTGLLGLAKADTVVCRCENVRKEQVDLALAQGVRDITSLKMRTRIAMGDCQGKTCASYCYDRFKEEGLLEGMGQIRPRFPLDPISFAAMEDN